MILLIVWATSSELVAQGVQIPKTWTGMPLFETLDLLHKQVPFEVSFNAVDVERFRLKTTGEFDGIEAFFEAELPLHELTLKRVGEVWLIVKDERERLVLNVELRDAETDSPISGAYVMANGRTYSSDSLGLVSLPTRSNTPCALHLQHIAYEKLDTLIRPRLGVQRVLLHSATVVLQDVTIQNERYQTPTRIQFKGQTIKIGITNSDAVPSFGGEKIWGLLKSLPGIYAAYEVPNGFLLKGDLPGQSAIRFEDIRCYELEHYLGNISGVMPASLREVSYSSDLPSAAFGDVAGGLLKLSGHELLGDTLFANVGVNRLMVDASVGVSLWKGAALTGGYRKTVRNLFEKGYLHRQNTNLDRQTQDDIVNTIAPEYSFEDANLKFTQKIGRTELKLAALMASDRQSFLSDADISQTSFLLEDREATTNKGESLVLKQLFNRSESMAKLIVSHSYLSKSNTMLVGYPQYDLFNVEDKELANSSLEEWFVQASYADEIGDKLELELGLEHSFTVLDYDYTWNSILTEEYAYSAQKQTAYFSCKYNPSEYTTLSIGLRANSVENDRRTDWEPRLAINQQISKTWSAYVVAGKQSQFLYPVLADKGGSKNQFHWVFSEPDTYPSRHALHLTTGVQYTSKRFDASVKGHYRYSPHLIAEAELSQQVRMFGLNSSPGNTQLAYAYRALEFFYRYKSERYSCWASYILAEGTRNESSDKGRLSLPTVADQRHELKLAQQFNYGNWHASLFALWGTGLPIFVSENAETEQVVWRTPNFKRLDCAVFYLWKAQNFETELGLSLQNILNESNSKFTTSIYTPSLNTKGFEFYYEMGALPFTVGIDLRIRWHK